MTLPEQVPGVLPEDWDDTVYGFQISVAARDDLGFPIRRRGTSLNMPQDPRDHEAFAKKVGEMVEETIRIMMGMKPKEAV